jgi:hypothetical protein
VNVNRNTIDAAASNDDRSCGRVTNQNARSGPAPRVRAAPGRSGSKCSQVAPTVRTTTETLNSTWAARIAGTPRSNPSGSNAPTAAATTTVGSTNGTVTSACTRRRPGNR